MCHSRLRSAQHESARWAVFLPKTLKLLISQRKSQFLFDVSIPSVPYKRISVIIGLMNMRTGDCFDVIINTTQSSLIELHGIFQLEV